MTLFHLSGLSVDVPGRRLLDDITLDLPAGRATALIGHNGSGKSTLLTRAGPPDPRPGHRDVRGARLDRLARPRPGPPHGLSAQTTPPADGMLVRELVALGRYPWHGAAGPLRPRRSRGRRPRHGRLRGGTLCRPAGRHPVGRRTPARLAGHDGRATGGHPAAGRTDHALDIAHQVEVLALVAAMCHDQGPAPSSCCMTSTWPRASATMSCAARPGGWSAGGPDCPDASRHAARHLWPADAGPNRPDGRPVAIPA